MALTISKKLILIRARLQLTQQQLADKLGVSFATVNRWERGHTKPSIRYCVVIQEFALKHGVHLNDLEGVE